MGADVLLQLLKLYNNFKIYGGLKWFQKLICEFLNFLRFKLSCLKHLSLVESYCFFYLLKLIDG